MQTSTETFVIISPPDSILRDITYLKQSIREILGHAFEGEFAKAHVSLLKYKDPHTDNELYEINSRLETCRPFTLFIKDFDVVQNGNYKSICLNVINKNPVRELSETITGRDINPHIVVAKNLSEGDFEKVWSAIKGVSYSNHFRCDHLTVLKRSDGPWRHYMDLPFYN